MSTAFSECIASVRRLRAALGELESQSRLLDVDPLAGREWFEVLERRLLPQLHDDAFLVVAVVGGTNIGKSVVFNHLAGTLASSTSPMASGTKHPVCLVPAGFEERHDLESIFSAFDLQEWTRGEAALEESETHRLYWQTCEHLPGNLLVLDTPDVDSDARVNWERADNVRRSADVLLAVLTQQKYNDAAVKTFFRKAAEEDKAVLVLFNQCQLPDDEPYVPVWLDVFCRETNVEPEFVYVAPQDRQAAEELRLSFYEWPLEERPPTPDPAAYEEAESVVSTAARNLVTDLSQLRFDEIKLRTLRGSLARVLQERDGLPGYLQELRSRSREFQAAAERLRTESQITAHDWPTLPRTVLSREIRDWWRKQQSGVEKAIVDVYSAAGNALGWSYRKLSSLAGGDGEVVEPLEEYRRREWSAIVEAVGKLYQTLEQMTRDRNDLLRARLEPILSGRSRETLLTQLQQEHAHVDFEQQVRRLVDGAMTEFQQEHPGQFKAARMWRAAATYGRPATSVVMFCVGVGPFGDALLPAVLEPAGGILGTAVGESAMSGGARFSESVREFLVRLHDRFVVERVKWMEEVFNEYLLDSLPADLQQAATVSEGATFRQVTDLEDELREFLRTTGLPQAAVSHEASD